VTDAQVDVGARVLRLAARPERADRLSLGDDRSSRHGQRPEMQDRHCVAVGRLDGQRPTVERQGAGEADDARGRGHDRFARVAGDVDAAVMAGFVLAAAVLERPENPARGGPAPGVCGRRERQGRGRDAGRKYALSCQEREHDEQR
jgi:hypothetical protein